MFACTYRGSPRTGWVVDGYKPPWGWLGTKPGPTAGKKKKVLNYWIISPVPESRLLESILWSTMKMVGYPLTKSCKAKASNFPFCFENTQNTAQANMGKGLSIHHHVYTRCNSEEVMCSTWPYKNGSWQYAEPKGHRGSAPERERDKF